MEYDDFVSEDPVLGSVLFRVSKVSQPFPQVSHFIGKRRKLFLWGGLRRVKSGVCCVGGLPFPAWSRSRRESRKDISIYPKWVS